MLMAAFVAMSEISIQERKSKGTYNTVAQAKIILRCIDQNGIIVTNANVSSALYPDGSFENAIVMNGTTDTNGCFVMEGKTNGEYSFTLKKDGFYKTHETKHLFLEPTVSVSSGRWQPYGMTNTVILKRKINPVAMCAADFFDTRYTLIPEVEKPLGFDLIVGDWIAPHGRGKIRDFDVTYIWDGSMGADYTGAELILSFADPFSGARKIPCDTYSSFKSPYHADTNAVYAQEIRFSFKHNAQGRWEDGQLKEDECLILRTRSRIDEDGHLIGVHYGKIYGPLRFGFSRKAPGEMKIFHYFNPTENDANLEYDPNKTLLFSGKIGTPP